MALHAQARAIAEVPFSSQPRAEKDDQAWAPCAAWALRCLAGVEIKVWLWFLPWRGSVREVFVWYEVGLDMKPYRL